jgi:hypothetical protein
VSVGLTAARLGFVLEANAGFLVAKSRSACVRAAGRGTPDPAEHYKSGSECLPRSENLIENVVLFQRRSARHAVAGRGRPGRSGRGHVRVQPDVRTPRELRHSFVSILSAHDVRLRHQLLGQTQQHVGHRDVHRHEIRPALIKGAICMDLLKAKAAKLT